MVAQRVRKLGSFLLVLYHKLIINSLDIILYASGAVLLQSNTNYIRFWHQWHLPLTIPRSASSVPQHRVPSLMNCKSVGCQVCMALAVKKVLVQGCVVQ